MCFVIVLLHLFNKFCIQPSVLMIPCILKAKKYFQTININDSASWVKFAVWSDRSTYVFWYLSLPKNWVCLSVAGGTKKLFVNPVSSIIQLATFSCRFGIIKRRGNRSKKSSIYISQSSWKKWVEWYLQTLNDCYESKDGETELIIIILIKTPFLQSP